MPDAPKTDADVLFGDLPSVHRGLEPAYTDREVEVADTLGLDTAQRKAAEQAFSHIIHEAGLDANVLGRRLYNLEVDRQLAEIRGRDVDEAAANTRLLKDTEETRQRFTATYGREEGQKLIKQTQEFVKRHPGLAAILARAGIGSRADVVIPIAEEVRRRHHAGLLK